jgi:NADH-quinone oxidoreductase subunit L
LLPYAPWLVWIVPALASLFVPILTKIDRKVRDYFVILVSLSTVVVAASMVPDIYFKAIGVPTDITAPWIPGLGIEAGVLIDPLSVLFANLIAFLGLIVMIYSLGYMAGEEGLMRYYFFMLLFIGSMIGLVMADNFLQMFIFWEMVGLCSYSLISFYYKRPEAVKAGMKVFLMTRVGDICLLAAIAILYINLGTFSFIESFTEIGKIALPFLSAASFLTLIGAVAKSAQLPLHTWLYSAMEAPTSVSCLLHGATMVKGGIYLIARTHVMFNTVPMWLTSVAWIGGITALIGATLALYTPDIKGVPAYSTISQIGFMMAGLGTASSPSAPGWFAGILHMLSHAFFQGLGFLAIGSIVHQLGTRDMRKMGGLRRAMPISFALCVVVILARSGIPPFASFFSKGLIVDSILSEGNLALAFLIYGATAITFAYSLRFLFLTFIWPKSDYVASIKVHEAPRIMWLSASVLAVLCAVLGFFEPFLIKFMRVNVEVSLSEFTSFSFLIFLFVLFVGGVSTYFAYLRTPLILNKIKKSKLVYIDKVLARGYYFNILYDKLLVNGFIKLSMGVYQYLETLVLERLPYLVARGAMHLTKGAHMYVDAFLDKLCYATAGGAVRLAKATHEYADAFLDRLCYVAAGGAVWSAKGTHKHADALLDELLYLVAGRTVHHGSKIKKVHTGSLPHFVMAAVLGFLFLCTLLLLTMLR